MDEKTRSSSSVRHSRSWLSDLWDSQSNANPITVQCKRVTDDFWELITAETNRHTQETSASTHVQNRERAYLKEVSVAELKRFMGVTRQRALRDPVELSTSLFAGDEPEPLAEDFGASFISAITTTSFRAVSPATTAYSRSVICCA